jgi:hypothetical protein
MHKPVHDLVLIGGTALLYSPALTATQRQAALDSILYAQLLANKQAGSRFANPEHWCDAYRQAFRQLGWLKLASTLDQKVIGETAKDQHIQPLEAWLKLRGIQHEAVLAEVAGPLSRSVSAFEHLLRFASQDEAERSKVVVEIGVLKAGLTLDLCSIALQTTTTLSGTSLQALLRDHVLHGEATFNGISLALDNVRFDQQREELRTLMASKNEQGAFQFDLGTAQTGGDDE